MFPVFFVVIRWFSQPEVVQNRASRSVNEWGCSFGSGRKVCSEPLAVGIVATMV